MKRDWGLVLIPRIAALFIWSLYATLRVRFHGAEVIDDFDAKGQKYVIPFWHGHLLLMVYSRFKKPMTVMMSKHRDGELIARTVAHFGVDAARGSTTRGGLAALREMLKIASRGENLAFTPDGPKGPARVLQIGVVLAAQKSGSPIIPAVVVSEKKKFFRPGIDSRFRILSLA
ncbi:MAG TPA: lysophospholipid acyltransferase family protein [Thermoanaerobaculia bacterium]|nr:lysophospholipid acyltransferase family protein [Thermoanaerobaculia bacterium]